MKIKKSVEFRNRLISRAEVLYT